jgi:transcriptional adapter 3
MDFFDESDHGSAHKHATEMWKIVDQHFAEFTEEDIRFCSPVDRDKDPAFTIPKLGTHYSLSMNAALDRSSSRRFLPGGGLDQSVDALMPGSGIAPESVRGSLAVLFSLHCHISATTSTFILTETTLQIAAESITSRLLSALIEENGITAESFSFDDIDMSQQGDMLGQSEMITEPNTMNMQEIELIDQRIRSDLKALALLEEGEQKEDAKEDDEICTELRKLQGQLKAQLNASKKLKAGLLEKVTEDAPRRKEKAMKFAQLKAEEKALLEKLVRSRSVILVFPWYS